MVTDHALSLHLGQRLWEVLAIHLAGCQHVVNGLHQGMGHRHQRAFVSDLGFESIVFKLERTPLLS